MKIRRYSLSIHVGTLFILLTAIFGSVLIYISYHHAHQLLTKTAKELSVENSHHIENKFKQTAAPIFTTLDLISYSSLVDGRTSALDNRSWLASMTVVFKKHPHLVALYFANDAGDFTIIRPLLTDEEKAHFKAPDDAILLINETRIDGRDDHIFVDESYQEIARIERGNNQFDPRVRPWFKSALSDGELRLTEPYLFYFLKTTGITLSRRSDNNKYVVAADFTLASLSESFSGMGFSRNTKMVLFDQQFNVLGEKDTKITPMMSKEEQEKVLETTVFKPMLNRVSSQTLYDSVDYNGEEWSLTLTPVTLGKQVSLILAEATPTKDILSDLLSLRNKQVTTAIGLLVICFLIVLLVARKIASPLRTLITLSENIARFDFKKTRYPKTIIKEVSNLTSSLQLMEHTLHDLLMLLRKTAENTDFNELAKTITHQSYLVTRAETILIYVFDDKEQQFNTAANHAIIPFKIDINELIKTPWLKSDLMRGITVHINKNDNIVQKFRDELYNSDIYLFPLLDKQQQLVGILNLSYERSITPAQSDKHAFLEELLSFAQLAKENIDKIQQHKDMMNAFVELIASAIDTKSPYTGSHCQRVPKLATWLTQAADQDNVYYPKFKMTSAQWEELKLASWLHDCGKVTTPEYVIDKATKLETIYDRIHEVRMRFEVLKKQNEVEFWRSISEGGDENTLKQELADKQSTLDEEFQFVAKCNLGSERMSPQDIERLSQIAKRTWTRTLNNQLGLSWTELNRFIGHTDLPVEEPLISDRPEHLVRWEDGRKPQDTWQEPFTLMPGDVLYNRGELYNLSVTQGTLTKEERFIINDHIVQTISMLKKLPYPPHLRDIPDIAGSHHERMDGRGYPRSLAASELSVQARSMAIADVFEALTSKDRPYKKAKSLSEAINIMTFMATSGHLDPKLYLLFLEKEIYIDYAKEFLDEQQIDNIDKETHIRDTKAYIKQQIHNDSHS
ncbi:HD domain-containing phosphohydrolase [Vibrio viridaestus]|uniref:HD domain-containing protein n=1 Tax=Vibrio viridaestus TaxID=2487322 RepID=A0A3N9TF61_9VIBR|nr:HD domain-containing phosphohydrolase [Vibrio viridaestus]RQW62680.1 HD domain-containing protein [Vibrio viridaestus]